uniref:Uncharacterized protein n=1 Tax=Arundo donax TaxID=35708 RepID=A0A0A9BQV3_ARUDO
MSLFSCEEGPEKIDWLRRSSNCFLFCFSCLRTEPKICLSQRRRQSCM